MASIELRAAAQQALEALDEAATFHRNLPDQHARRLAAMTALRAALAEPVQQGCDHCNHPLYAAIKCRVCGRVTEPVQEPDDKAASIRWQLCLLAQTEEFSDDVRNQIGRGVWLIDRLCAALAEPVQEQPVCDECGKHKRDGWALYCVDCVEPVFALSQPPDSKHAKEKA